MSDLSLTARRAINAQETDQVFLVLLTISHPDLSAPIRVVDNDVDVVSRGETYVAYPFSIELPGDDGEQLSRVSLTIDNVHRDLVPLIRAVATPPIVVIEVILASAPDLVEAGPFEFELQNVGYDVLAITGQLAFEPILAEPFPAHTQTPHLFPGLFR